MKIRVALFICFVVFCSSERVFRATSSSLPHIINTLKLPQADISRNQTGSATTKNVKVQTPVNLQYPHAVLVGRICGGSIISSKWILTAAHCSIAFSGNMVVAGTNNTADGSGIIRRVKRMVLHPLFSVGPYWVNPERFNIKQVGARYDFLLAELDEPLPLDNVTMTAAKLNENQTLTAGTSVGYAGYGSINLGETMRHHMHGFNLRTLSVNDCSFLEEYNSTEMICAKGVPPDYDSACGGDSGSGLVDGRGVLIGVLSWIENDAVKCHKGAVVYFSKVAIARDWIRQVTNI